ncbi:NAD(P)-binding protein [Novosphingobium sp. FSY-8]|uniref:NAD(P)-binding protein n=1 Tax=Novosphingobium ovatum TaxID=1908523 RepID=A0ABW9XE74_9SPHN|nr:NAD(P)-binding protein [Novosphingobium ovatum]NBC36752.1 NAD(P)-binding protein [Novosphingobium ovatum]
MKAEPVLTRRAALAGAGAAGAAMALGGCAQADAAPYPGAMLGPDMGRGHALRDGRMAAATTGPDVHTGLLIAGGGVAGLAAGWRLKQAGFDDFLLLELEDEAGGNARAGANAFTAFPWGAHYLPLPNREGRALIAMLRQFGMVTGTGPDGAPIYDPLQICADLEERLLWNGQWQEGLYPASALGREDRRQRDAFFAAMGAWRHKVGADGRPAFACPMAYSSRDPAIRALDGISMAAWMARNGYTSAPLLAHVRYACRDDYGAEPEAVSAWAGLHYFAGRRAFVAGHSGRYDGDNSELTWPEGNARLTRAMAGVIGGAIRTGHSALHVAAQGDGITAHVLAHRQARRYNVMARGGILAMPDFVARHVAPGVAPVGRFSYAPWVVANITVTRRPEGPGVPLAWDNVSAASDHLGYVVADHQTSAAAEGPSVLTWYTALSAGDPVAQRRGLQGASLRDWQRLIADDLLAMHPDMEGHIARIDVWRWGHAMVRPTPGFLSDPARLAAQAADGPIWRAHSDISGLSLFEEAHYRGCLAAEAAMRRLGHPFESLLT